MNIHYQIKTIMKKEVGILIASATGLAITLGWIGVKRFLSHKNNRYCKDYNDYHRLYMQEEEDSHGIEYYAMK